MQCVLYDHECPHSAFIDPQSTSPLTVCSDGKQVKKKDSENIKLVHLLLLQTIAMVSSEVPILVIKPEIFILEEWLL